MKKVLIIVAAVFVFLFIFKNALIGTVLGGTISSVAHVPVKIGSTKVSFGQGKAELKNIRVRNPGGFPERMMLDAPEISIDVVPSTILSGTKHIEEIRLNIKELIVIRNKQGKLNVDALKPKKDGKPAEKKKASKPGEKPKVQIDKLYLTIGKVVYKDYSSGGQPSVQTFDINIKDRVFTNLNNPAAIVSVIMVEALTKTTLSRLAGLDATLFKDGAMGVLDGGLGVVGEGAGKLEDTAKGILKLF